MSLHDLLSLADDALQGVFTAQAPDLDKIRKPILKGIERARTQYAGAAGARGKKWFKINNDVVELNLPFAIDGKSTFYIANARFPAFLDKLEEKVTGGELDKEIAAGTIGPEPEPVEIPQPAKPQWGPGSAFSATVKKTRKS